jgi:hypothetical protein
MGASNISMIRIFRVLRTLKTLSAFPNVQLLVQLILKIIPEMGSTFIITFLTLIVFGCLAVQLFSGHFINKCVLITTITDPPFDGEIWLKDSDGDRIYC